MNFIKPYATTGTGDTESTMKSYWLDTRWGCGLITVNEKGLICNPVAPIFKALLGGSFNKISHLYKCKLLEEEKK